ncbi:unnamed protein product [Camellia sinensis]
MADETQKPAAPETPATVPPKTLTLASLPFSPPPAEMAPARPLVSVHYTLSPPDSVDPTHGIGRTRKRKQPTPVNLSTIPSRTRSRSLQPATRIQQWEFDQTDMGRVKEDVAHCWTLHFHPPRHVLPHRHHSSIRRSPQRSRPRRHLYCHHRHHRHHLRLLVLGLFCYVGCGGCPQSWTVFSEQAFVGLWDFFKLSVASGVMLSLENFYYRVLIIISGNMNNDEVQSVVRRIKKDVKRAPMMKTLETRSRPCRDEGFSSWRI